MEKYIKYYITVLFLTVLIQGMLSQSDKISKKHFIETIPDKFQSNDFELNEAIKSGKIKECHKIYLNNEVLKDHAKLSFKIKEKTYHIESVEKIEHFDNCYSLKGKFEKSKYTNTILTIKNDQIVGYIFTDSGAYNIHTSKDNQVCLLELSDNDSVGHVSPLNNSTSNKKIEALPNYQLKSAIISLDKKTINTTTFSLTTTPSCRLRVLFMYTPAVLSHYVNDIMIHIHNTIVFANQCLEDSEVPEEWELAYAGLTNYTEHYVPGADSRAVDLFRFHNPTDGFMDEVHDLRETYNADVCVLISECTSDDQGRCGGQAVDWEAIDPDDAFCLAHDFNWGGLRHGVISHEVGHLMGAGHADRGNYTYGRATENHAEGWRTIMGSNLTRIPYYSNPEVDHPTTGTPTGTTTPNNNARVLREQIPVKCRFLQPDNNLYLTANDLVNLDYGDVVSEESVSTTGSITLQNGMSLTIRSKETTINPNFSVELGAGLTIINESVIDCP